VAQKLAGLGDGNAGREIGLLLSKYDLLNLKAIARGKFSGRGSDEIEKSLIPAGTIKPAVLSGLAAAPDLGSLAQNLNVVGHPLANSFRTAVAQLEVSLDQAYYSEALKRSSDTLTNYFKRDIDGANILTALKLKAQGNSSNSDRYFVAGGKEVSRERFALIASGTGGLDGLAAFSSLSETTDLGQAETVVRNVLLADAKRLYTSDALGVGVVIGFLKEKENEVALTRLIARGKFYGVPNETLRKEVGNGL
jgi:V/A-type H+-transporting ATPase subunit C